ncbi:MAG: GntR family transcriptional regulator [Paracoccaceae bacterium]|nr:GntR family transcriptional regulator [Paracoccaceae bacterium]MDE2914623.1 GntR family transcriptional regulator [Paracoccaceae bacterium]
MLNREGRAAQGKADRAQRFRPLSEYSGSLANRTYHALRDAILDLSLRPGESLRKPEICQALGVSRSPLSEAVTKLVGEGLLHVKPQAGTYVATFSIEDIREGAFLREAIELAAIEYLAPRITDPQLRILRRNLRIQKALAEDGDFEGFYRFDEEFHEHVLLMTGFRRLKTVADAAWVNVNRARRLLLPVAGRIEESLAEHGTIVDDLANRDPDRARLSMRLHLRRLVPVLSTLETERPELFGPSAADTI